MTLAVCTFATSREDDLGLRRIANQSGLAISVLPNGCVFAIEHQHERARTLINQVQGSPLDGGIARLYLRVRAPDPAIAEAVGPSAQVSLGAAADRFTWDGGTSSVRHHVSLWLHPQHKLWLWRVEVANTGAGAVSCEAILVQDVGLGDRGFLMNNEAYASQYIDHHVARHRRCGPVVMSRQNLKQSSGHPWVAHGCFEGAAGFATDAMQLLGPSYRDADEIDPGLDLPSERLQHEVACAMIQSPTIALKPGGQGAWTFFGMFEPDHAEASSDADLAKIDQVQQALEDFVAGPAARCVPVRSLLQDAAPVVARSLDEATIAERYPERAHEERADGRLFSFFTPDVMHNRHVVLRAKERMVPRRHGTLLRSGQGMLLDETTLCATCWMHGVFATLLTIGNTAFHKLFSAARDPYNIVRSSGLRILIDAGAGWRLLAVPSAFEMGLSDCRWIYRLEGRTITVRALAAGDDPAMQWRIAVEGKPCRFLVFGQVVLGERELDHAGRIEINAAIGRFTFRPDRSSLWGQRYPDAVYHLVISTPDAIETIGGDELLYADGQPRGGAYVALRTRATNELGFAVVGSMTDPEAAERLAAKYDKAAGCLAKDRETLLAFYDFPAEHWKHVRTANPIESTFATVRLRTDKTKGCLSRETALAMVFKLTRSAERHWRRLNGSERLAEIIRGVRFRDGEPVTATEDQAAA
jgi:1,2-beta-oligoglucan phosphorylase